MSWAGCSTVCSLGEFIYEQPAVGDVEYTFKHALTQEVAYNSILSDRRKRLHERTGAAIETLYAASLDDHVSELAHHYSRSGNADKAAEYLRRAGQQALARSAYQEALAQLSAAIEFLGRLPESLQRDDREAALQLARTSAMRVVGGIGAEGIDRALSRTVELSERTGNTHRSLEGLQGLQTLSLRPGRVRSGAGFGTPASRHGSDHGRLDLAFVGPADDWANAESPWRFHRCAFDA